MSKYKNEDETLESVLNEFGDNIDPIELQTKLARTRLKLLREDLGMRQKDFAQKFGVNESTYSRYESGDIANFPQSLIAEICKTYSINPAWLMGYRDVEKYINFEEASQKTKRIPVLGNIAAGAPIFAQQELMGYEIISDNEHVDFCLRVKGDSMNGARIFDGDIVFIRTQPDVEHGEVAAVIVDGEDATLKRIYKSSNNTIILHPENPAYRDLVFSGKDTKQVKIIGKAVSFKSEVK